MRVFITGGAGFIGSHLTDALIARGDEVTILDNLSTGSAANIAHLEGTIAVHQGDIRDAALVEKLMAPADLVLHMAAALGVNTIFLAISRCKINTILFHANPLNQINNKSWQLMESLQFLSTVLPAVSYLANIAKEKLSNQCAQKASKSLQHQRVITSCL